MDRFFEALAPAPPVVPHIEVQSDKKPWVTPAVSEASMVDRTLSGPTGVNSDGVTYS